MSKLNQFTTGLLLLLVVVFSGTFVVGCNVGASNSDMMQAAKGRRQRSEPDEDSSEDSGQTEPSDEQAQNGESGAASEAVATTNNDEGDEGSSIIPIEDTDVPLASEWEPAESVEEARARSIENMTKIAQAFVDYVDEKRVFPPSAMTDRYDNQTLSWRVSLLPYLGYEKLYRQFKLEETWDSPHNLKLLAEIPACFRNPLKGTTNTPYVVPRVSSGIFKEPTESMLEFRIEDGRADTLMLVEVGMDKSVPWTKPADLEVRSREIRELLTNTYEDGCFIAWANGQVDRLLPDATNSDIWAAVTAESGDRFRRTEIASRARVVEKMDEVENPFVDDVADASLNGDGDGVKPIAKPEIPLEQLLSQELLKNANSSLGTGLDILAFDQRYAAQLIRDKSEIISNYSWVPALRKPAFGLKFGVGVVVTDELEKRGTEAIEANPEWRSNLPGEEEFEKLVGEPGLRVLSAIRQIQNSGAYGEFVKKGGVLAHDVITDLDSLRYSPGVYLIGWGDYRTMRGVAKREAMDVVILIEIEVVEQRRNEKESVTSISVSDAQTGAEIYQFPEIHSERILARRNNRLAEDPLNAIFEKFESFLVEDLALQNVPELEPEFARERLDRIVGLECKTPIPAFAEIQFYYGLGLLSEYEVRQALQGVGDSSSQVLLDGRADDRLNYLNEWLKATSSKREEGPVRRDRD